MSKVLVTGGDSFTGTHLLPILESNGYNAISLIRSGVSNKPKIFKADITDIDALRTCLQNILPDYIIHLAGISFAAHPRPLELYETNTLGAENLLQAAFETVPHIKKIILASTATVYGTCESTNISETVCPSPVNHYGTSKLAMEQIATTWMKRLPITIVRPFNYTGVGQDEKFLIPKIVSHFARKASTIELGNIKVARDFTDVRTICQYYLKLLNCGGASGEVFNLCSGRLITLEEILKYASEISGSDIDVMVNPAFVRKTDIMELRGNPDKLYRTIGSHSHPPIQETIRWMLENA